MSFIKTKLADPLISSLITTGHDYSKDVIKRMGWFQLHGWV